MLIEFSSLRFANFGGLDLPVDMALQAVAFRMQWRDGLRRLQKTRVEPLKRCCGRWELRTPEH